MKVLFFGNHTVGVKVLEAIQETEEVVGVIAHPADSEDGVRYASVYDYAVKNGRKVIRSKASDPLVLSFVLDCMPDLIVIADYRYLLPESILALAKLGAVNFHPSILPKYRGRAPINWAILKGEKELGLTVHFVDRGVDTGDIIAQEQLVLSEAQDVGDALEMLYPIYSSLARAVLQYFRQGNVPRHPQNLGHYNTYPARKPEDGLVDWNQPATSVLNLIRAVAFPYPGAFTTLAGKKIIIWHARRVDSCRPLITRGVPGQIITIELGELMIQCVDYILALDKVEYDNNNIRVVAGMVLGS